MHPVLLKGGVYMKIGKRAKAKKYKTIREKQAIANKMIKNAKTYLKPNHKAFKELKAKKKQFYNSRGLKAPAQLSFKSLSSKDIKAYEKLLDSIIDGSTWFNEDKYKEHDKKMREKLAQEGINDIDKAISIFDYDIVNDLVSLAVPPSEMMALFEEYSDDGFDINDFVDMLTEFNEDEGADNITEFFNYAYLWKERRKDFLKRVDDGEYLPNEYDEFKQEYSVRFYERE